MSPSGKFQLHLWNVNHPLVLQSVLLKIQTFKSCYIKELIIQTLMCNIIYSYQLMKEIRLIRLKILYVHLTIISAFRILSFLV